MEQYKIQDEKLTFALDIGTRNVIGMVAKEHEGKVQILAVETQAHEKRTMMDGQIEDIDLVASVVRNVTSRLEEKMQVKLPSACVAAAGRALRTEQGTSIIEYETPQTITSEIIGKLEAQAVGEAESALKTEKDQRMYLVGYTCTQTLVDSYPMRSLLSHVGKKIETTIVATFLPSEVIESLYAVMNKAGLEIASLTLEPIAALNAAIPVDIRLLNLALVDIGAGTSDIAICRDGSVIGYTMATVAGDEITETLMKKCLIDYNTAERIKASLSEKQTVNYTDILGIEQKITPQEATEHIKPATSALVSEIAQRIKQVNGGAPSAVFLAGGGSKLDGICKKIASELEMDEKRVAIAGGHFKNSAFSMDIELNTPEYTTPLGIAISAVLGLISDSYRVTLNGEAAKLFRSGSLTALEILMMNGYTYQDLLGKNGKNLVVEIDGTRKIFAGETAVPASLNINGKAAQPSIIVNAGDIIDFVAAVPGKDAQLTVQQLLLKIDAAAVTVNGVHLKPDEDVPPNAVVSVVAKNNVKPQNFTGNEKIKYSSNEENSAQKSASENEKRSGTVNIYETISGASFDVRTKNNEHSQTENIGASKSAVVRSHTFKLNGKELDLPLKSNNEPYYLMDMLVHTDIDFDKVTEPVELYVNGEAGIFSTELKNNDVVEIIAKQRV